MLENVWDSFIGLSFKGGIQVFVHSDKYEDILSKLLYHPHNKPYRTELLFELLSAGLWCQTILHTLGLLTLTTRMSQIK